MMQIMMFASLFGCEMSRFTLAALLSYCCWLIIVKFILLDKWHERPEGGTMKVFLFWDLTSSDINKS